MIPTRFHLQINNFQIRSGLFRGITQSGEVIPYRRFGTNYRPPSSRVKKLIWISWPLKIQIFEVIYDTHIALSSHLTRQVYGTDVLHPPRYFMTTAGLRSVIKETNCIWCKTRRAIYVWRNVEARSRNICSPRKPISITCSECVSEALVIQHAKCMRRIVTWSQSGTTTFSNIIT